jgi:hypothetical protein
MPFEYIFEGLEMENVGIFCGHFGIIYVQLVYHLGIGIYDGLEMENVGIFYGYFGIFVAIW